jgi:hypothetical protein
MTSELEVPTYSQSYLMDKEIIIAIIALGITLYVGICLCILLEVCQPQNEQCSYCSMYHGGRCPHQATQNHAEPLPMYETRPPSYKTTPTPA